MKLTKRQEDIVRSVANELGMSDVTVRLVIETFLGTRGATPAKRTRKPAPKGKAKAGKR